MTKYFLVIARYPPHKQNIFDTKISPLNEKYCLKHDFEYVVIRNEEKLELVRGNPTWWKFSIVQEWIKSGKLQKGDIVTHFDADMIVVKDNAPYQTTKSFSYAIDNGNTHCMGNYTLTIDDWSIDLVNRILDETLYQELKNNSHWQNFREQAAWYTLAGIRPHSWGPFPHMSNFGFHSNPSKHLHYS